MDSAISKLQACNTADELFAVTNALLTQVQRISRAARVMPGPTPIRSGRDLDAWVRELKARTNLPSADESTELLAQLFVVAISGTEAGRDRLLPGLDLPVHALMPAFCAVPCIFAHHDVRVRRALAIPQQYRGRKKAADRFQGRPAAKKACRQREGLRQAGRVIAILSARGIPIARAESLRPAAASAASPTR